MFRKYITIEIQHDRPNRKVYRITKAGETELTPWLQTHHPLLLLREPLLVQLYPTASREQKLHQLVLDLVKQREQTYLDWLEKAIRAMHTLRDRDRSCPHSESYPES